MMETNSISRVRAETAVYIAKRTTNPLMAVANPNTTSRNTVKLGIPFS